MKTETRVVRVPVTEDTIVQRVVVSVVSDAEKHRLKQAEQLLRDFGYREVQTPDGPKWKKAENRPRRQRGGRG